MQDYPKNIKKLIRQYLVEAYEIELHRELTKLDQSFSEWRNGSISSGELSHRIHQYEIGPSRELYKRYNHGDADLNVAYAIVAGVLDPAGIPAELLAALERPLSFYRSLKDQDELRMPGE